MGTSAIDQAPSATQRSSRSVAACSPATTAPAVSVAAAITTSTSRITPSATGRTSVHALRERLQLAGQRPHACVAAFVNLRCTTIARIDRETTAMRLRLARAPTASTNRWQCIGQMTPAGGAHRQATGTTRNQTRHGSVRSSSMLTIACWPRPWVEAGSPQPLLDAALLARALATVVVAKDALGDL